ncbi:hypothetical protein VTI74DRAFT_1579 [Chaetomium olivicolor]
MLRQFRAWLQQKTRTALITEEASPYGESSQQVSYPTAETQLPSYYDQESSWNPPTLCRHPDADADADAEPPTSIMAINEDPCASDKSTQQSSQRTTEPSPYAQSSVLSTLPNHNLLSDAETAAAISAAISTAALAGISCSQAAKEVAAAITHVANSIAVVPAAEARVTATAMTTAINDFAAIVAAGLGDPGAATLDQADRAYTIESAEYLPRFHVAVAVASAVAKVANAVAAAPTRSRWTTAVTYISSAKHTADQVRNAVSPAAPFSIPQLPDRGRLCGSTYRGSCEAALQAAKLQAALHALRDYTAVVGQTQAARVLDAVAAGPRLLSLYNEKGSCATCTCSQRSGRCEALLQAHELRAALSTVWSLHEGLPESSEEFQVDPCMLAK